MPKLERSTDTEGDWGSLNTSELVLNAQDVDENAHRGMERSELIRLITKGSDEPLPTYRPDKYRLRIMEYLNDNWQRVEPLIRCPARSRDPRACFSCTDIQVAECSLSNAFIFKKDDQK